MACVRKYRGSWVVDYRDANGKRHIEAVESQDAGNEKLGEIAKALRSKTYDPGRAKTPLKDYAVEWLQSRRAEISRSTFTSYEYALRVHILPDLGRCELGRLARPQVRLFLGKKADQKKMNGKAPLAKRYRADHQGMSPRDARDRGRGRDCPSERGAPKGQAQHLGAAKSQRREANQDSSEGLQQGAAYGVSEDG